MRAILKRDIILPAGTVFEDAPIKREMSYGSVECIVGLTPDTSGVFTYFMDELDEELDNWFEVKNE